MLEVRSWLIQAFFQDLNFLKDHFRKCQILSEILKPENSQKLFRKLEDRTFKFFGPLRNF